MKVTTVLYFIGASSSRKLTAATVGNTFNNNNDITLFSLYKLNNMFIKYIFAFVRSHKHAHTYKQTQTTTHTKAHPYSLDIVFMQLVFYIVMHIIR